VQDAAAALAVRLLAPVAGERVLDLCAAPGGKTLQLAAAGADVTALDMSGPRLARLHENLSRCGLQAQVVVADALVWEPEAKFDIYRFKLGWLLHDHAIEIAAMLARTMANLESEQRLLRTEGFTSMSERGTPVVNPRAAIVKGLAGDVLSFRRSLSLHARAQKGEADRVAKRADQAKAIEAGAFGDDIFPAPSMQ
jgi:SAM-dependent methyltransferase